MVLAIFCVQLLILCTLHASTCMDLMHTHALTHVCPPGLVRGVSRKKLSQERAVQQRPEANYCLRMLAASTVSRINRGRPVVIDSSAEASSDACNVAGGPSWGLLFKHDVCAVS